MVEARFIMGAAKAEQFPKTTLPETAFIGRSNVGKSSLINSIVYRKQLALTSGTPGKTRQINFFNVEDSFVLADMPGLGYAKLAQSERETMQRLNYAYLDMREQLALVCVLLDSRHDPSDIDLGLIEWLENRGRSYVVILTKCDKLSTKAVQERRQQILELTAACSFAVDVVPYSVVSNLGRNELWGIIKRLAGLHKW